MDLKGRSFLTLLDFNKEEIRYMLDLAHELKAKKKKGILGEELKGKNIVLVFDKSSPRIPFFFLAFSSCAKSSM